MSDTADTGAWTDWRVQRAYWESNYATRSYVVVQYGYSYYELAYQYGVEAAHRYHEKSWDEIEADLRRSWETPGQHWEDIKGAVRDAWERVTGNDR